MRWFGYLVKFFVDYGCFRSYITFADFLWSELPTDTAGDLLAEDEKSTLQLKAKGYGREIVG